MNSGKYTLLLFGLIFGYAWADDTLNELSRVALYSTVSQSLAGAGIALPASGTQGLINPALPFSFHYAAKETKGSIALGYGRDPLFNQVALPIALTFGDQEGATALYYRYLNGKKGTVQDFTFNMSGRLFEQVDKQGPVDFGLNIRYDRFRMQGSVMDTAGNSSEKEERGSDVLMDLGFYQPYIYPGLDFALVFRNVLGYRWSETSVSGRSSKKNGWTNGKMRTVLLGTVYNLPLAGDNLKLLIPFDLEITGLFDKSPVRYIFRAGTEAKITPLYSVRFGYARAPENPIDLLKDFDYRNLFFGGGGINVKPVLMDFFIGKEEWGITATYEY